MGTMEGSLEGKLALVTGAGTGIGQGVALELSRRGASVVLQYAHSATGAEEAVGAIREGGGRALSIQADLKGVGECRRLIQEGVAFLGGLDILVNSTGITKNVPFEEVTEELYDELLAVNVRSFFFCAQEAVPHMVRRGGGAILNMGSLHAVTGMPGHSVYAATKGADVALTRQLAMELAPKRIRVNSVAPGSIEVPRKFATPGYDSELAGSWIPWGRVGYPEDIARAVAFLVSDDADYITGQLLPVDGGISARLCLYVDHKE